MMILLVAIATVLGIGLVAYVVQLVRSERAIEMDKELTARPKLGI